MRARYLLAIDQGTTSSRALLVDPEGDIRGLGQHPLTQHYPRPGWVEHDLAEIWSTVEASITDALAAANAGPHDIAAVGITNQRETIALWDRATGQPVARAIVWQDRRTAADCDALRQAGQETLVQETTGLTLDPYFSATKLGSLFREHPALLPRARSGELAAGTIDSWLIWKLTGGRRHVTDLTNASRTLLFDVHRQRWDERLCNLFGVPPEVLPEVLPSIASFGDASPVLGAPTPITGVAGDQQSALAGQMCHEPGTAKCTYGTGAFLLAPAGATPIASRNRLLVSLGTNATPSTPEYILEGSVFVAGAAVQWLRDELGIIRASEEVEPLAASVPDTGGVTFVPAFTGLGAPDWDAYARGALLGLTRGTTRAHIARAALEGIALSCAELIAAMSADLPVPLAQLRVDGGAANNDLLMQMQADFAGIPVVRPRQTETTALGAAYLAGLGSGFWATLEEVAALWQPERTFEPAIPADQRAHRLAHWRRAVGRTHGWADA